MPARLSSAATVLAAIAACGQCFAQNLNPFGVSAFSATMTSSLPGRGSFSQKIYYAGGNSRIEMPNGTGYMLFLMPQKTGYMVMAGHCMATPAMNNTGHNPFDMKGSVKTQNVGSTNLDGHPTTISLITVQDASGKTTTMKAWRAMDLKGFPLRIEMPNPSLGTVTVEYQDVSLAAPPASLFEKPSNCMTMPGFSGGH